MRTNTRREDIIDKSKQVFAQHGFKRATMDSIAESLNIRKGALYYYFKSKEELFFSVTEMECEKLKYTILNEVEKESDPRNKLIAFFYSRLMYYDKMAKYYKEFKKESPEAMAEGESIFNKYFKWECNMIKSIIGNGIKEGVFGKDNFKTSSICSVFSILLNGFEYNDIVNPKTKICKDNIESLLEIIYKGIE